MPKKRDGLKQLNFEIPDDLHTKIKRRAAAYNLSVRNWIIQAMNEKLKNDKDLGWE